MKHRATLSNLLHRLKSGSIEPLPPEGESPAGHVERISRPGVSAEINEEQFDYWFEVLPPHWMDGSHFCFAEGWEPFRLFWRQAGRCFVRQLLWPETLEFCLLAGIPTPS